MTESVTTAGDGSGDRTCKRKLSSGLDRADDKEDSGPTKKCLRMTRASSAESQGPLSRRFWELEQQMCRELSALSFSSPVTHIYNPLDYARQPHQCYLNSYADSPKKIMFFGMNPGPFGMAQTGVCEHPLLPSALLYLLAEAHTDGVSVFAPICV